MMVARNTILLVHNDTEYLRHTQKTMEAAGFYPDATKSHTEALEKIPSKPYKAIVVHYGIGDIDGLGILQQLSKRGIAVPVIVLVDPGSENIIIEAMKAGAADYLVKSGDYLKILPFLVTRAIEMAQLKQAAHRAEDGEPQLRLQAEITKNIAEGIYIVGYDDHLIKYANPKLEEMFGYKPGEMTGKHISIVNAPTEKSPEETAREIGEIIYRTGKWRGEILNIKKDGARFWCYANVSVFNHPDYGKVMLSIHSDISERKKAEDEAKERNGQLFALHQVSQSLTQSIELEEVAKKALETTLNVLNMDAGTIRYLDETTQELVLLAHRGLPRELSREMEAKPRMKPGQGLSGNAAQQLRPLIITDLQKYPDLLYKSIYNSGFSFYVRIPLSVKGKLVGTISCFSRRQRIFTGGDLELLSSLGNMVGIGITNARLFKDQNQRTQELVALNQVSQAMNLFLNLGDVADVALEESMKVLKLDGGVIRYLDEKTREMVLLSHNGLPQELAIEAKANPRLKSDQGLTLELIKLGQPMVIQDFASYPDLKLESMRFSGFQTWIGLPLKVKDKIVGMIAGLSRSRRLFTPADIEMLSSLGNMVGISIANARLFEEQKQRTEELSAINQVSQMVSQSLDLATVAPLALKATLNVMGLDAGAIRYLDTATQELVTIGTYGLSPELEAQRSSRPNIKVGEGLAGLAAKTGQPQIITNLGQDSRRFYGTTHTQEFHSAAFFPLKVKDEIVGVISSFSLTQRDFKPADLELMTSLSNMVGMAIANVHLFGMVKDRAEKLVAIHSISTALASTLNMEDIYAILAREMRHIISYDRLTVGLLTPEGDAVFILQVGQAEKMPVYQRLEDNPLGEVVKTGEPLIYPDLVLEASDYPIMERLVEMGFHSVIVVSLSAKGKVLGTLNILSREVGRYSLADLEYIQPIANQLALALSHARLFEQVEAAAMEWRNTFDSMNDGVSVHSPDFRILRANRPLAQMLGATPQSLIGQLCHKVIHGLDTPTENCPLTCLSSGKPTKEPVKQERNLGNRWLRISCDPVLNPQGQLLSVVHTMRDITEEKQRQDNLEHLYRLSQALSTSLDLDTVNSLALDEIAPVVGDSISTICISLIDEQSQDQFFVAARGLYQKQLTNVRIPLNEIRPEVSDLFREQRSALFLDDLSKAPPALKRLSFWNEIRSAMFFPLRVRNKSIGILITYSQNDKPLPQSQVDFLTSCASEIAMAIENARLFEQTDEALKHRVAELEAIITSMAEGLIVVDAQRKISYYNPAAERLLGNNAIDLLTQPIGTLEQSGSIRTGKPNDMLKTLSLSPDYPTGKQVSHFEVWLPEHKEIEATFFTIDKTGQNYGSGVLLRDITREREVDRMKTEFVSLASHELRTPMTVIYGFAELLLMSKGTPVEQKNWVGRIYNETQRLTNIVDDFLNITLIESGRLSMKRAAVSIHPVITQLVSQVSSIYQSHSFKLDIPADLPEIWVDAERLTQVLYNLMDNAAKYSPMKGPVTISAYRDKSEARAIISVADNGLGISEADLPKLFARFHRIHRPETANIRGTGLGLHIVKSLVEMMGGSIWVESQINKGSAFYISLPLAGPENPPHTPEEV